MTATSGSARICTKLEQIAKLARGAPDMVFTTLAHRIDIDWMREAHRRTRKDGASGVDRQSAAQYARDDAVLLFANEDDARRMMDVLPKRFGKYGLTLRSDNHAPALFPTRPLKVGQ